MDMICLSATQIFISFIFNAKKNSCTIIELTLIFWLQIGFLHYIFYLINIPMGTYWHFWIYVISSSFTEYLCFSMTILLDVFVGSQYDAILFEK